MRNSFAASVASIKEIVGGFTDKQMIAIGVALAVTLVLGFMIGALALYAVGVRRGRAQKKISARKIKQMQAEMRKESELALAEAEGRNQALLAEREADAATLRETMGLIEHLEQTNREAEQSVREVEEQMRQLREEGALIPRKSNIEALTREEVLAFAAGLEGEVPVSIYERGSEDLPVSCRAGICTFMLVYERNGVVKIVLRLHKKTASDLKKKYKLFAKAAFPKGGDWYKWILTSEIKTLADVEIAIRMSYKYVYRLNYDAESGEVDAAYVNGEEAKINEEVLRYKDLPDRDFIVASGGSGAAFSLYGKKEMAAFVMSLAAEYPVTVSETESDTAPSTCKVVDKSFLLAYEKDGVAKMIFRVSEEEFDAIKRKHPRAEVSAFPSSTLYKWYVTVIDETFHTNEDIEEIIKTSCAHVYSLYN